MKTIFILFILTTVSLIGCSQKAAPGTSKATNHYHCPMHPEVTSDKPGVCPICNMDLVKTVEDTALPTEDMPGMISLTQKKQLLANVSTTVIHRTPFRPELVSYSYLDFAEDSRKLISARFNGRIEKLFVNMTGTYVTKGQPLFEIYSPDLVEAQNEYLVAIQNTDAIRDAMSRKPVSLVQSARKRLELFGMTEKQIALIDSSRMIQYTLTYYSPTNGTVIEKRIQEGMYVNEGTLLYDIADMSTLWGISEVYEKDLSLVKVGNRVKLKLSAYPGETFEGTINFIYPVINAQTRTIKVRSIFTKASQKLRPQMYGEIIIGQDMGMQLLVPRDAVLFTGKRQIVWTKLSENQFESKEVVLGMNQDGKYQVLSGLNDGDEIVETGGFLMDSESQLRTGRSTGHLHESMTMDDIRKGKNPDSASSQNER